MATRGPQNSGRGLERGRILGYWALNKFFDPSTPSMKNIESPSKSKMVARGPQNGRRGLKIGLTLGYWPF